MSIDIENLVSIRIPSFTDAKYPIDIKLSTYTKKDIVACGYHYHVFDMFMYWLPIGLKYSL